MSLEHLSAVLDHSQKGGSHLAVLLIIASYSDQRGEWVADQPTLQKRARLGRRRVQQLLAELTTAGELAVTPGDGRGHRSTYRLLLGPSAPKGEAGRAKSAAACVLSTHESETHSALSHPPCPPCPSFPPDPQYSLNPPYPPENLKQETFGLPPAPATARQAASAPASKASSSSKPFSPLPAGGWVGAGRGAGGEVLLGRAAAPPSTAATQQVLPGVAVSAVLVPPLPGKAGGSWERGGGEGSGREATAAAVAVRQLSAPQSATFRTHLLLEEAAVPLPSPAQIGLWAKTLGGIEPLLDLLRRLIHAGLATKRAPLAYIHRVVLERAARPEPFSPLPAGGWGMGEGPGVRGHSPSWRVGRQGNPTLAAGVDDIRREQAARIAGITLPRSGA